ncbi:MULTISPECIES: hypothetical protein [unclassified Vibrio]|uniref:hypothetical protein n=1 Tax=unclassified Vibrio TaxID=2614977 RepID=UPI000B8EB47E|nr:MULTISPECIES: hypothetical protein [unclassified Vibrio]NAX42673.1 hypothetical protein [Vibrio sp. V25_P4S6T154]OXX40943.1 hypothetical protein B9J93_21175 [Vibrio sp. V17_P4S1T151]OXX59197.1 hypothetical protein B9J89_19635 [Vibrio sp. V15_P4S5T153]OXX65437.1 hypothetical protein B9J94_15525 [Vibrio sp. V20_P4S3T152]
MSVKNISRVKQKFTMFSKDVDQVRTEAAVYTILSEGGALAQLMTPMDTGTLANSQYAPQIAHSAGRTHGTTGYTAKYAGAVHEMPGTLKGMPRSHFGKTGNQSAFGPRQVVEFGGGSLTGNYWDPDAEPKWLTKAFSELQPKIPLMLERAYRV